MTATLAVTRSKAEWDSIRKLALALAHGMLKSGAETYRIEETAYRVLEAYGATDINVFAISNFLSVSFETPEGDEFYGQKRVQSRDDNLWRIALLNDYTRRVCSKTPNPEGAAAKVDEIMRTVNHQGFWTQILITAYVGFGFALMLGTSIYGAIYAFFLDAIMRFIIFPLQKLAVNKMFVNIVGGFVVTILAIFTHNFGLNHERSLIVAASFMYLFPGISLMNSIRDIISNDLVAGLSKLLETLLAALSIAIGAGVALGFEHLFL